MKGLNQGRPFRRVIMSILLLLSFLTPALGHRDRWRERNPVPEEFSPLFRDRLEASLADMDQQDRKWFFQGLDRQPVMLAKSEVATPLSFGLSVCLLSACLTSVCTQSGCLGSFCEASVCTGSFCIGSACTSSLCGASFCLDSFCLASACANSTCLAGCKEDEPLPDCDSCKKRQIKN